MTDSFVTKQLADERQANLLTVMQAVDRKLEAMDKRQRTFELECVKQLAELKTERKSASRRAIGPIAGGATGGGVIAALMELARSIL